MSEHDEDSGAAIDWPAYPVPAAPAGAVDAIVGAVERGGPKVIALPRAGRRGGWLAAGAAALVLAAAALVLVVLLRGDGDDDDTASPAVLPDRDERETQPGPRTVETWSRRFASPAQRAAMERAIREARIRRAGGGPVEGKPPPKPSKRRIGKPEKTAPGAPGEAMGELDKEYIQSVVKDAAPLLQECYELALTEDPALSGKLTVEFTIAGEPDVGGLVEEASTSTDGIGRNRTLSECVRETMLSLEFPAPTGGGTVEVHYPFLFSTGDEPPPPEPSPDDGEEDDDGDDAPDDTKAAAPLSTRYGPAELTAQARDAARAGQWATALRLCESAASMDAADPDNAMVCALAACNLGNAGKASKHLARLNSPARKGMARQTCLKHGVDIPID